LADRLGYGSLPDGRAVTCYRLQSPGGACAEILDLGGIIRSLKVPDRHGNPGDIVMGYENLTDQLNGRGWNCGIIGRCVNRIGEGRYRINGRLYQLDIPQGMPFVLHGGMGNYAMKLFSAECWTDSEGEKLRLYHHDRGEGGFNGEVDVWVTYVLTPDNELQIRYRAIPEEDTILNLTSHCYFNLAGHGSGTAADHLIQINADFYLPAAEGGLPTGEVLGVKGTALDLTSPRRIREGLYSADSQIKRQGGYDHNYCLRGTGYREAAVVYEPKSGRRMTVYTDLPGVQFYTAGNERPGTGFKDGQSYGKFDAFCLETQYFPDATAHSHFPQPVILAGALFQSTTAFRFTAG
jgi:aldose 1-epimerase